MGRSKPSKADNMDNVPIVDWEGVRTASAPGSSGKSPRFSRLGLESPKQQQPP